MATQHPDKSEIPAALRANIFPWPPVLFAVAIGAAWLLGREIPLTWTGIEDMLARVIGLSFGLIGIGLIAWSVERLMRHGTTVMPDGQSTTLVTSGPYRLFRNPIYLGEALLLLSAAELTKNVWFVVSAVVFAVSITALQIIPEERHLEARFGASYGDYKARTRRWI